MKILILANNDIGLYNFRKELIEKLLSNSNEEQRKNIVCYYDNSNILKLFVKDKNKRISDLAKKKLKVNK